jgi:hypothetical protein
MLFTLTTSTIFHCSLSRAFKSPMLCDITKVHTGYGTMPRVTHCTEEEGWGKLGAVKKVFVAKTWAHEGGFASRDRVVERVENKYWKIEVFDFPSSLPGFDLMVGE